MTRRALAALAVVLLVLVLAGCGPADDPDRCVPPTPSPTGAPWVEADDGEPCALGADGIWREFDDGQDDVHAGDHKGRRAKHRTPASSARRTAR